MAAPEVPQRALGRNGPQVPALGLGLMGLSAFYGKVPSDEERFEVLDHAWAIGARFWDSADMYMDNEDLLGKWFARHPDRRADIFLATKFANTRDADGKVVIRNDPPYIRQACERSLQRLGLPSVDLYYVHRFNNTVPAEDMMEALVELKREGKFKYIGVSECSAETLRRCHAVHPVSAVQVEYSPWSLDIESPQVGLLAAARELGVAVVAYSPLGRGFLSGRYRSAADFEPGDFRSFAPRFSPENFPKNLALADRFRDVAERKGCTPAQLALAWLLRRGDDILPIPGTKRIAYLDENWGALRVHLTDAEDEEIRRVVEGAKVSGGRYPEAFSRDLYGDTPPRTKH